MNPRVPRSHARPPRRSGSTTPTTGLIVAIGTVIVVIALAWNLVDWIGGALTRSSTPERPVTITMPDAPGAAPTTPPLDFSGFDAGDIISNEVFFNWDTMNAADIDVFISAWNAGCTPGPEDTACLAAYRESTPTFPADQFCTDPFIGGEDDTAGAIIDKAAYACGINPQVLIVMLQKEQGLITASGARLTPSRYRTAMGYACPDTARCNPEYFGFARQVYFAARQFSIYEADPASFRFRPGATVDVAFNPDPECGAEPVSLANQATAGLYNYTPYQPNDAALAGGGDGCSAFGNANFYAYFHAWFGPTH